VAALKERTQMPAHAAPARVLAPPPPPFRVIRRLHWFLNGGRVLTMRSHRLWLPFFRSQAERNRHHQREVRLHRRSAHPSAMSTFVAGAAQILSELSPTSIDCEITKPSGGRYGNEKLFSTARMTPNAMRQIGLRGIEILRRRGCGFLMTLRL
jgi:hypothetical protein